MKEALYKFLYYVKIEINKIEWRQLISFMIFLLFIYFSIGYFLNGLFRLSFDINACWTGIGLLSTTTIFKIGKHYINSKYNSKIGEVPKKNEEM